MVFMSVELKRTIQQLKAKDSYTLAQISVYQVHVKVKKERHL